MDCIVIEISTRITMPRNSYLLIDRRFLSFEISSVFPKYFRHPKLMKSTYGHEFNSRTSKITSALTTVKVLYDNYIGRLHFVDCGR